MTKTHLIAQRAIRRHLPKTTIGTGRRDAWFDGTAGLQFRQQDYHLDPLSQQVKRACEPCNRDWMGEIENDVAADVIALAKGENVALDASRSGRLAVWAAAVAMLRSTQDPGPAAFDMADARALRATSMLPAGYVVWLIRGEQRWDFPSRHQRFTITQVNQNSAMSHVTWFWIGEAIFMVTHPAIAFVLSRMNVFGQAVQILAPYGDYPIIWPTPSSVPHSAMIDLTSTFYRV